MLKYQLSRKSVQWEPSFPCGQRDTGTCLQSGNEVFRLSMWSVLLVALLVSRILRWRFFFNSCPTLINLLHKYCSLCTSIRQKKLAALITTWTIFVYCYRNGVCVFFTVVVILTLRRPALMAVWFRIFSSFVPRAYKIVLIFIVCFRYAKKTALIYGMARIQK
jgi:hypothetical protein